MEVFELPSGRAKCCSPGDKIWILQVLALVLAPKSSFMPIMRQPGVFFLVAGKG